MHLKRYLKFQIIFLYAAWSFLFRLFLETCLIAEGINIFLDKLLLTSFGVEF